jgi:phosphoribosyl-dephospho-CoA transferase
LHQTNLSKFMQRDPICEKEKKRNQIKSNQIKSKMDRSEKCETRNFPKCPFCEKEYQENKFCMTMDISGPIKQCKYGNHICDNCVSKVENCTSCKTGKKSRKFDTRLAQFVKLDTTFA